MKLYTEEQVKQIFANLNDATLSFYGYEMEYYCNSVTPIELPSDDEIEKFAEKESEVQGWDEYYGISQTFIDGAKWIKEQILNQNR
jgi:hypothetical protein